MLRPRKRRRPPWTASVVVRAVALIASGSSSYPPDARFTAYRVQGSLAFVSNLHPVYQFLHAGGILEHHASPSLRYARARAARYGYHRSYGTTSMRLVSDASSGADNTPSTADTSTLMGSGDVDVAVAGQSTGRCDQSASSTSGASITEEIETVNSNDDPTIRSLVDLVELLESSENPLWDLIRFEGREASKQSYVSSMIHGSILAWASLEDAITCDVSNKMATTFLSPTEVSSLMRDMFADEPHLDFVVAEDLLAQAMQDASLPDVLTAMLFHKGFTAITTYRLMHWLWRNGRKSLARYLQSICSEVCAADIHPACRIGNGVLIASGCDIVIGETAVVGDGVCLLHGVTLGGTGNQTGDRHPKVAKGCHIGAGSSVLGNIVVGEGSRIEAASVVVKPVKPYTVNRGVPSKPVAFVVCDPYQDVKSADTSGGDEEVEPRRMFTKFGSLYIGV